MSILDLGESCVPDDWKDLLQELLDLDHGLTRWEVNFLDDLSHRLERDEDFAPSWQQYSKLREIHEEKIGRTT